MQAFATLHWHAQHSKGKKVMLAQVVRQLRHSMMAAAFAGMRERCSHKRRLRVMAMRAMAHWQGSARVTAFQSWARWTHYSREAALKVSASPCSLAVVPQDLLLANSLHAV
jgi:hypothetical protein